MLDRRSQNLKRELIAEFPELKGPLQTADSLLAQVSEFGAFTQQAKAAGDWPTYERCVALADRLLAQADAAAVAFQPAFFEQLEFEGSRGPVAWQLLTARLQAGWKAMDAENRRLMALPQSRQRDSEEMRRIVRGARPQLPRGPRGRGGPGGGGPRGGPRGGRGGRPGGRGRRPR